jgi:hypothetical protein
MTSGPMADDEGLLTSPPDSADPPSDEELLAFLDVIYDARRVDA